MRENFTTLCLLWSVSHGCWAVVSHHLDSTLKPGDDSIIVFGSQKGYGQCVKHYIGPGGQEVRNNSSHLLCSPQSQESWRLLWLCEVFVKLFMCLLHH